MKFSELFQHTFRALRPAVEARIAEEASRHLILHHIQVPRPSEGRGQGWGLVERHLSDRSGFCRACVRMDYLTMEQMQRAAQRYRLGMTRDGGVIFWQVDQLGNVFDGKVMYYREDCHRDHSRHPTWVSNELKRFYLGRDADSINLSTTHCLFGTHLLGHMNNSVCVVEAEKTAVIMSEHFPQYLWMATGGLNELTPVKLFPLRGRKIILFPDTDPDGKAYTLWYGIAQQAQRLLGQPVTVSPLLELNATAEQKHRKIDLVDFLFEGHTENTESTEIVHDA